MASPLLNRQVDVEDELDRTRRTLPLAAQLIGLIGDDRALGDAVVDELRASLPGDTGRTPPPGTRAVYRAAFRRVRAWFESRGNALATADEVANGVSLTVPKVYQIVATFRSHFERVGSVRRSGDGRRVRAWRLSETTTFKTEAI